MATSGSRFWRMVAARCSFGVASTQRTCRSCSIASMVLGAHRRQDASRPRAGGRASRGGGRGSIVRQRRGERRRLEQAAELVALADLLGRERPGDPVRALVLADQPALVQTAEDVADHRPADAEVARPSPLRRCGTRRRSGMRRPPSRCRHRCAPSSRAGLPLPASGRMRSKSRMSRRSGLASRRRPGPTR